MLRKRRSMTKQLVNLPQIENVLITAGECAVTVLPQFGGKIASIRIGEHELLQTPLAPIAPRTRTMAFDEGDASGWDECLPSVAGCKVETDAGTVDVPDHGDLWRVEWEISGQAETSGKENDLNADHAPVALTGRCFSLPLELKRRIDLRMTSTGWRMDLSYELRNTGQHPVPWSWAAHPLFAAEEGDRIVLPRSIHSLRLEGSGDGRLGKAGTRVNWPQARLAGGRIVDLGIAEAPDSRIGDKLFTESLGRSQNWCMLERPSAGLRIRVSFDPMATQYLGLWICYGGWPERPGPKQMCVALEPATAPVDSLAMTGAWSRVLAPGESFSWPMEVEIEQIER